MASGFLRAQGATQTWSNDSGDFIWNTTSNDWANVPWANGNIAIFGGAGTGTIAIGSGVSFQTLQINASGYTFTGTNALSETNGANLDAIAVGTGSGSNFTSEIDAPLQLGGGLSGGGAKITVNGTSVLTLTGGGALWDFNGTGTLNLNEGTDGSAKTYTTGHGDTDGNIVIGNGVTVSEAGSSSLTLGISGGSGQGSITVNNGGKLDVSTGNGIRIGWTSAAGFTSTLTENTGGTINMGGKTLVLGNSAVSNAAVNINGGIFTSTGTINIGVGASGTQAINVSGGTVSMTGTVTIGDGGTGTQAMNVSGGTVSLGEIKFNTVATTGTASFTLTGGNLYLAGSSGIGILAGSVVPGTLTFAGGTVGASAAWSTTMAATLGSTGGVNTTFQAADASGTAHNISLGGVLSGAGGLTTAGTGTVTLSGANTYTGKTLVGASSNLAITGSQGSGSIEVQNLAHLTLGSGIANMGLQFNLGAVGAGSNDTIVVDAGGIYAVTSGSTVMITVNALAGFQAGTYVLIDDSANSAALNLSDYTLSGLGNASLILANNNTELELQVSAVPEPGTWALLLLGGGFLSAAARRPRRVIS